MTAPSSPSPPAPPRRRATKAPAPPVERRLPGPPLRGPDHRPPLRGGAPPRAVPPWRAPLVGALLIPLSALFGIYSYEVVQALHWTMQSLKCGPIFVLFLLMVGNLTVRRIARR